MLKNNSLESVRSTIKRQSKRGFYDFDTIAKILDDTFICQVGFSIENRPFIIPTVFGRKQDKIYFHGSNNSRMLKSINDGAEICFTVTILDGIVLARSAFHHSVNYRSVVLFGHTKEIKNDTEKLESLKIISEHILPGRWDDVRLPNDNELKATTVLSFEINEGSAKIRTGPPVDDKNDMDLPVWPGVLPLKIVAGKPIPDTKLLPGISVPDYVKNY